MKIKMVQIPKQRKTDIETKKITIVSIESQVNRIFK